MREASRSDEHALFWRVLYYSYYSGLTILAQGRTEQAVDALHTVVTRPDTT